MMIKLTPSMDLTYISDFAKNDLVKYESENQDNQNFPSQIIEKMHDLSIFLAPGPKEFGGQDLPVTDLIWLVHELSYGSASAGATFIGNLLGYSALLLYGEKDLRQNIGSSYCKEKTLWSFAMTEAGVGSDLLKIETTARRTKEGFVLNGEKNFITNASHSSHLAVFARLLDENGKEEGISCFYIPGNTPGLTRGTPLSKIGWKKANTGALYFKNAAIPKEHLLGKPGDGLRILTHCLNRSKTLLAAMGAGIAKRAIDLATERLAETERFGKSLLDQAAIRHLFAKLHTQRDASWLLTTRAAATWDAGKDATKESSMAKLFAGAMAVGVCSDAMELFGARGFLNEFEVSRLVSDAKAIEIVEGPSFVQELLIARAVLPNRKAASQEANKFVLTPADLKKAS